MSGGPGTPQPVDHELRKDQTRSSCVLGLPIPTCGSDISLVKGQRSPYSLVIDLLGG
jgi:hypothetical protein